MLRRYLQKYGAIPLTIVFTALSILISIVITILVNWLLNRELVGFTGLFIAILVPAVVTPTFTSVQLSLLLQLYDIQEKLQKQATTDELTQVFNRRYFIELAEEVLIRSKRQGGKFSIIILDMDNFKHINDTYGHSIGDQMLRHFSEVCQDFLPETALLARYGGDEFVFLLRDTDLGQADQYANEIRKALSKTFLEIGQEKIALDASLGSAEYHSQIVDLDTLLAQADQAMYVEKRKKGIPPA